MESVSADGAEEDSSAAVKAERKGWLSKRSRFTNRWRRTWFELKDGQLLYGRSEEVREPPLPQKRKRSLV